MVERDYHNNLKCDPERKPTWDSIDPWEPRTIRTHCGEIVLSYAICKQLAEDILAAYARMQEYPVGTDAWYEWRQAVIINVDLIHRKDIDAYAICSMFDFSRYLKRRTTNNLDKYKEVFNLAEWEKY